MSEKDIDHSEQINSVLNIKRKLKGPVAKIATGIAVFGALIQLYIAGFASVSELALRSIHWTYITVLIFLLYPATKKSSKDKVPIYDLILATLAVVIGLYIFFCWKAIAERMGFTIPREVVLGTLAILVVLEACRRVVGNALAILAGIFLAYGFAGPYLPMAIAHRGYGLDAIVRTLYISTDGIFGMPIAISASYVVLFILFGSLLQECGGGKFFTDIAFGLVGKSVGGPAKAAVVSSSLMGMLSGAAVANVVTTGTFTIPLMKKSGYPSHLAGAIEAVASTGGQFVPPVMGAAAFMIAEVVGVPYGRIALAAIIPSVLYYIYLYLSVDLEAKKAGLKGINKEDIPSVKAAFRESGHLMIPLVALVYMIIKGYSPGRSIFLSILMILIVSSLKKSSRMSLKDIIRALESGIHNATPVAAACAAAGIITGMISVTGIGLRFSSILISLSGNSVMMMLILTMIASLILGMGLPTSAAYVILAVITGPALITLGVEPISAHFFIFFFGCISTITPPVALSAYAGAGIAGADPMKTGFTAFRLGLVGYIVPFLGVFSPAILLIGKPYQVALFAILSLIAIVALTYAMVGYRNGKLKLIYRLLFVLGAALVLIKTDLIISMLGILLIAICFFQTRGRTDQPTVTI